MTDEVSGPEEEVVLDFTEYEVESNTTEWPEEPVHHGPLRAGVAVATNVPLFSLLDAPQEPPAPRVETRAEWGALPPKSNPGGFTALVATVCHYTAASHGYAVRSDQSHSLCEARVRSIQRQHQAIPNQSDIEYNALLCNHGVVFEGRVSGYKTGANGTLESNQTMPSVCCLLGIDDQPEQAMLDALVWFHDQVEAQAGTTLPMKKHKEIVATSCPGAPMTAWVDAGNYNPAPPEPEPEPEPEPLPPPVYTDEQLTAWYETLLPTLRPGTSGTTVALMQGVLKALGYNVGNVDGVYGKASGPTGTALQSFQSANGIVVDGVCGNQTWQALLGTTGDVALPRLAPGTTNRSVRVLQGLLFAWGYGPGPLDGIYGTSSSSPTRLAVDNFKGARSLPRDGVVDVTLAWPRLLGLA